GRPSRVGVALPAPPGRPRHQQVRAVPVRLPARGVAAHGGAQGLNLYHLLEGGWLMAPPAAEPRGPEPRRPDAHIEQAIGRLYRFLAANRRTRFSWAVIQTFSRAEGALLSGSMAYYTFLSLLPLLMVAAFVLATFASPEPEAREAVAEALNQVFPGIGSEVFNEVINQVVTNKAALGGFGLLSVAYAGSGFVGSMTACLNRMWRIPSGRNPVGQKIVNISILMLLGSGLPRSGPPSLSVS